MRFVIDCNPGKRGCDLCADHIKVKAKVNYEVLTRKVCPYDECPYRELDDVKKYSEYDKRVQKAGTYNIESWLKKVFVLSEK